MVILSEDVFGSYQNKPVKKFTWQTDKGISISVISYGATIQSIKAPNKYGIQNDLVLGFDDLEGYVTRNDPHFGGTIGRCANRIGGATFQIDGVIYKLVQNIGQDHLHGGTIGFDKVNWESVVDGNKVIFSYLSKDGEECYPGDLIINVIYEVLNEDTLSVQYTGSTTKKTVVNLTNHSYFNLAGDHCGAEELYKHIITLNADKITETTSNSIPTGRFLPVGGTLYDLRVPTSLGDVMSKDANLYDDNFCLTGYDQTRLNFVARVVHPESGRFLEVYMNKPGVQLYTANSLPGPAEPALTGKGGAGYRRHGAFCLETQDYPDAVHHPHFPTTILKPGEVYQHHFTYTFGVVKHNEPTVVVT